MSVLPVSRFYNTSPTLEHCTGDIWSNLPTFGFLKTSHTPGLIITPACDLANDKVFTLTYLPIIPVDMWLCTRALYPESVSTLVGLIG